VRRAASPFAPPARGRLAGALVVLVLLAVALPLAGCGGTPAPAQQRRAAFLHRYRHLDDQQLAVLCPSLYPTDFLARPGHYNYTRNKTRFRPSSAQRAAARAAGCTARGTKPK
jgi:hypothetical protein